MDKKLRKKREGMGEWREICVNPGIQGIRHLARNEESVLLLTLLYFTLLYLFLVIKPRTDLCRIVRIDDRTCSMMRNIAQPTIIIDCHINFERNPIPIRLSYIFSSVISINEQS